MERPLEYFSAEALQDCRMCLPSEETTKEVFANLLTGKQLLQMLADAHEACKSENMNCPWCSGHLGYDHDRHDEFCLWPKVALEMKDIHSWKTP